MRITGGTTRIRRCARRVLRDERVTALAGHDTVVTSIGPEPWPDMR